MSSAVVSGNNAICDWPSYVNYSVCLFAARRASNRGVFSYFTAFTMLTTPLKRIVKVNEKIQIGLTAANSAFNVMDADSESDTGRIKLESSQGKLEFKKVGFEYESEKGAVLENISFKVENGKRVALVGASGSGKSTITSLILRFYHAKEGNITLDGHNIDDLILKDLREQVALVSQETTLFDDTIKRNIVLWCC